MVALLYAYQECLVTFKSMASQVVQRAPPYMVTWARQRVKLLEVFKCISPDFKSASGLLRALNSLVLIYTRNHNRGRRL